jgi:hypothetical protein
MECLLPRLHQYRNGNHEARLIGQTEIPATTDTQGLAFAPATR